MKKILLTLVTMLAAVGMNAQEGNVKMYIEVESTSDLKNIPVTIYMDNTVEIAGIEAKFALPEGLTADNFNENDDAADTYTVLSDRATKNHEKNTVEMFNKSKPNDLILSITTGTKTGYFDGQTGAIGTFYFDGSSLSDGEFEVKMYGASAFHDASGRYDAGGYHTPDQSADYKAFEYPAKFKIEGGTAVGITAIRANNSAVKAGVYNIAGQRLNGLQKGINIVNGQKVIVK